MRSWKIEIVKNDGSKEVVRQLPCMQEAWQDTLKKYARHEIQSAELIIIEGQAEPDDVAYYTQATIG